MLGQIKMATLNQFEQTGGTVEENRVDINDTETQLERVCAIIEEKG